MVKKPRHIVPVFGDQLSLNLSCLKQADPNKDVILMCEVRGEATYVKHHKKKIALIFSAMRHHALALRNAGWRVDYVVYDDPNNSGSFRGEVERALLRHKARGVITTRASEHRVVNDQNDWAEAFNVSVAIVDDDRFICTQQEFFDWAKGRKSLRLEFFYRDMRRKTGLLMDGDNPVGGQWNFDKENRKPAGDDLFIPKPFSVEPDAITRDVLALVEREFVDHFGQLDPFQLGVTAEQAEQALDHFITHALPHFGDYQDAMVAHQPFLYHSILSPYINIGLLDPLRVCAAAERAYLDGHAPLNSVEGFIRQIIGWREYVNGIYWLHDQKTGAYTNQNFFGASRSLPEFYWSGDTKMACVKAVVTQTRDQAYAHHIQRLMVTGLFAMLAGIDPYEVHEWYLAVYFDAFEWVEAPNVIAMSQYADGGRLGSKPYAASGAYIDRMSDYCKSCTYSVKRKTEIDSCPFNSLYWDFLCRHEDKLRSNPRLAQVYKNWGRMNIDTQKAYRNRAAQVLSNIGTL